MYAARLYENSYSPDIAPISPFLLDYLRLRVDTHGKHVLPLPQTEHIAHDDTRACTRLLSIFFLIQRERRWISILRSVRREVELSARKMTREAAFLFERVSLRLVQSIDLCHLEPREITLDF